MRQMLQIKSIKMKALIHQRDEGKMSKPFCELHGPLLLILRYVYLTARANKVNVFFVPSVFQTLQTTDPGAEREPPENHAKVRETTICVSVCLCIQMC